MLEILSTYGGPLAGVAGTIALIISAFKTNTAKVWQESAKSWREEAEVQKSRADRLIDELNGVKHELEELKKQTRTLVAVLSALDPEKLDELRIHRGL
jgi:hypothetical protein